MSDIFLSYAREDLSLAEALVKAFKTEGWSVWWDREIPSGTKFHLVTENELRKARCVIVLWSKHSIGSDWVIAEADIGRDRGVLIPVLLDNVDPPLPFRSVQTMNLLSWNGDLKAPVLRRLAKDIHSFLRPVKLKEGSVSSIIADESREKHQGRLQLEKFYKPIRNRLEKDKAIWRNILGKRANPSSLEYKVAKEIEQEILANHEEMLSIIDTNRDYIDLDENLNVQLQTYRNLAQQYLAIRRAGNEIEFSLDKSDDDWWHQDLLDTINRRIEELENEDRALETQIAPLQAVEFADHLVSQVKEQILSIIQKHYLGRVLPLREVVFPILRSLFDNRNSFDEHLADCQDENWTSRFIAVTETKRLIDLLRPYIEQDIKEDVMILIESYEALKLHHYLQRLSRLFEPPARPNNIADEFRNGNFEESKERLLRNEIHPKKKIDSMVLVACDKEQDRIRKLWKSWPRK